METAIERVFDYYGHPRRGDWREAAQTILDDRHARAHSLAVDLLDMKRRAIEGGIKPGDPFMAMIRRHMGRNMQSAPRATVPALRRELRAIRRYLAEPEPNMNAWDCGRQDAYAETRFSYERMAKLLPIMIRLA